MVSVTCSILKLKFVFSFLVSEIMAFPFNTIISFDLFSIYVLFWNAFCGKYSNEAHPAWTLPVKEVTGIARKYLSSLKGIFTVCF